MNNVNKKLKKADFIPVYNENSDFKKVSEYDLVKVNSIIVPVMNIICMEKGSNQLFPNMGVKNILMSIPFKERDEIDEVLYAVSSGITEYISSSVSVTLDQEKTNFVTGEVAINIEMEGVPISLSIQTNKYGFFKVHKRSLYK